MQIEDIIAVVTYVMDAAYDWLTGCAQTVASEPLLLFLCLLPLTNYGIKLFKKMIKASGG